MQRFIPPKFLLLVITCLLSTVASKPPNIVFMVADDYGWNDIGFRNPDIKTPNLDRLAREGVILNQSYVQPVCTPSRNAFMTGIYPFKAGLQHLVIFPEQAVCAPSKNEFLPEKLKRLGYATHIIGKWHLGFCNWNCTPTARGFDSFYGYYNGAEDYYTRTILNGTDFRENEKAVNPDKNRYSTYVYADEARRVISAHNKSQPLYFYMPFQSVHQPIQVPEEYENIYAHIKNEGRRKYSGMVTAMDDLVGNITESLKQNGLYDDTIIIFTADNGGWPQFSGNNFPLRGSKCTVYEGGTRATAFIHGSALEKTNYTYNGLMHAVDWMPTVLSMAGGTQDSDVDGIDMWDSLRTGAASKRTEFIYNLDDMTPAVCGHAAIRMGDFKLIQGNPGLYPSWYPPPTSENYKVEEVYSKTTLGDQQFNAEGMYLGKYPHGYPPLPTSGNYKVEEVYSKIAVGDQLFNVKDDPNERNDLSKRPEYRDKLKELQARMDEYHKDLVKPLFPGNDAKSDPSNYDGFWTPGWC